MRFLLVKRLRQGTHQIHSRLSGDASPFGLQSIVGDAKSAPTNYYKIVRTTFLIIAVVLGVLYSLTGRHYMNPDGVSYLDLADSIWASQSRAAINAYWSPLYPLILGLAINIFKPPPYWEATIVHFVNLGIYLAALISFNFFWKTFYNWYTSRLGEQKGDYLPYPKWVWWSLGYVLFLWAALDLVNIREVTPDMIVLAIVLLAAGLILKIHLDRNTKQIFAILGLILGLGFLTKAAMFPIAFVFLGVGALAAGSVRRSLPNIFVAIIIFVMVSGPFVIALSLSKNRLTFGDSAKLNYAWHVNGVKPVAHWQGDEDFGEPIHTTRMIFNEPNVYEFGSPIKGTYPPWSDPTYWYEGVTPKFLLKDQLAVLLANGSQYFEIFVRQQAGLIVALLILFMSSSRNWLILKDIGSLWLIIIPTIAVLGMYGIVHIETRYIGPFALLLWAAAFASVRLPRNKQSRQLIIYVVVSVVTLMMINRFVFAVETVRKSDSLIDFQDHHSHEQWQIAEDLKQLGIREGDRVAIIGYSLDAYWARLAGVQIVSDIFEQKEPYHDPNDVEYFWTTNPETREQTIKAIEKAGAIAIVADDFPAGGNIEGWKQLGSSGYFVFLFE